MKKPVYIRCPRCELNYIQKKDKYCNVCKQEMKALGTAGADEELGLELCPICKVNYINPDEDMCVECAKEKALEEGLVNDVNNDDDWDSLSSDDDGSYDENEETGDMVAITDLDEDPLDDEPIGVDLDDDLDDDIKDADDLFDEDLDDEAFDDLDDDDDDDDEDDDED